MPAPLTPAALRLRAHLAREKGPNIVVAISPAEADSLACWLDSESYLWIRVEESLPDADMLVIVALEDGETCPAFLDEEIWRNSDAMPLNATVTHWMNFPPAPKNEALAKARAERP